MALIIDIDIAQPDFDHLLIKDISDDTEYQTAFPPSGRDSVYAFYLALKHSSESEFRYWITKRNPSGGTTLLPTSEVNLTNASFLAMAAQEILTKYDLTKPSGDVLPTKLADGIYRIKYGIGAQPGSLNLVANKTYYTLNNGTINGVTVPAGSVLKTKQAATYASGAEYFEPSYEMNTVLMLSAEMKVEYTKAVIAYTKTKNRTAKEFANNALQEFRSKFDACKSLVLFDNYTEAVTLFEDCQGLLKTINSTI